ncbi:UNKNOWN [Stylonychia lemnae]|uniref:Methyltransferase FkbM domain-containing protein n=1 Tax=Stylonychia lemnae TaxID=5949 RepID=A0A078AAI8_STYLE|nr:UNKNOWN [Stylonychia lemnae]|eukprot:CDW78597.1 UNKNOWN [Stylonychia lemnae]
MRLEIQKVKTGRQQTSNLVRASMMILKFLFGWHPKVNEDKRVAFIDVGGNIGWFTLVAARNEFLVYTFEPMKSNTDALKYSLCLQPSLKEKVQIFEYGLGDQNYLCGIYSLDINIQNGLVKCESQFAAGAEFREFIQLKKLDDFIDNIPDDVLIGVMKIDIEGYEYFLFKGGSQFINRYKIPYIIIEFLPANMFRVGISPNDLILLINSMGYDVRVGGFDGDIYTSIEDMEKVYQRSAFEEVFLTLKIN